MASDNVSVQRLSGPRNVSWTIVRFKDPDGEIAKFTQSGHSAAEAMLRFPEKLLNRSEDGPNALVTFGKNLQWKLMTGALNADPASPPEFGFDFNNARLGISDDSTAWNTAQNFLDTTYTTVGPAASNDFYAKIVDATFPQISGDTIVFQATFGPGIAEWAGGWQSFGLDNDGTNWDGSGGWLASTPPYTAVASYENSGQGAAQTGIGLYNRFVSNQGLKGVGTTWILTLSIQQT